MYSLVDRDEMLRLFKVVNASVNDMNSIYNLYKKYIDAKAAMYRTDCRCHASIGYYYEQLRNWYSNNAGLFVEPIIEVKKNKK